MSQDLHDARPAEDQPAAPAPGLIADDSGAVLMWTIFIALPVFFALGAIAVDAHRTYNTFDEAQSFADHTALAAAMELNGQPGAIDRAVEAACGPNGDGPLVDGTHTYGQAADEGARDLASDRLVFFRALGDDPIAPDDDEICTVTCANPTCNNPDDSNARFVEVTTAPVTVNWLFWPMMQAFGVANPLTSADAAARATAGQPPMAMCNWAPLWMCNPLEFSGGSLDDKQYVGMQMHVKESKGGGKDGDKGGGSSPAPGNFGLVEAPSGHGGAKFRDDLKEYNPLGQQCKDDNSVTFEQGTEVGPVTQGFDSRFCPGDPDPMPQDLCFTSGGDTCRFQGTEFKDSYGKGDWCGTASCPTRFSQYLTDPNRKSDCGKWTPPPGGQLDRREFVVAVVDCYDSNGNRLYQGNSNKDIPVREYVRAFLTEQPGEGTGTEKQDIFLEYLGPANAETLDEVFKEYPVLYR